MLLKCFVCAQARTSFKHITIYIYICIWIDGLYVCPKYGMASVSSDTAALKKAGY